LRPDRLSLVLSRLLSVPQASLVLVILLGFMTVTLTAQPFYNHLITYLYISGEVTPSLPALALGAGRGNRPHVGWRAGRPWLLLRSP
jgi:hypothetical protein